MAYTINDFIGEKSLALIGASRSGKKFGNTILRELTGKGYKLALIHPEVTEIEGIGCYAALGELPDHIHNLILCVPPDQVLEIIQTLSGSPIRNLWMQQGSESTEAIAYCHGHDINVVAGECILMFAQPAGFHKFHRWIRALTGKLPRGAS